jgi:uncharacterized damage-inducible protein DinB
MRTHDEHVHPANQETDPMSLAQQSLAELRTAHEYFNRSTRNLAEAHSTFAPAAGMMTAAQQVAHVAQTIDWFLQGAFRPEGFDEHVKLVTSYASLEQARAWLERSVAEAAAKIGSLSDAELLAPMPDGPIMGGVPRLAIFGAINDHTAHHRGALTVYARLNGVVPPMPYADA